MEMEEATPGKLRVSSSLQDLATYDSSRALSFSKAREHSNSSNNSKRWTCIVIGVIAGLMGVAGMVFLYVWSGKEAAFYVVLDSGSTGTRAFVYRATRSRHGASALPFHIEEHGKSQEKKPLHNAYHRMETEPGLHKLLHNASAVRSAIAPLLGWAQGQIPKRAHKSTPVFLYATAGVRRLPSAESEWVMEKAWRVVRSSPFESRREWVRVLSGTEEAFFGWIALNQRTRLLGATPRKPTMGALDLGGSSLQVTFETDRLSSPSLDLRIASLTHHLTAYSLSGYGLNDAFDRSVLRLLRDQPASPSPSTLAHPCLNSHYSHTYTPSSSKDPLTLVGAPHWDRCAALALLVVNASEWSNASPPVDCTSQPCALPEDLPRPYGHFYAMSGFFVVFRFFNLSSDASLDDVLEKGRAFCEMSWEEARNSVVAQPFIEQYCFRAPYIVSLLREGLRIKDEQISIGSGSITWTLGVALMEAGKAFTGGRGYTSIKASTVMALVLVSLGVLACAVWWAGNWRPKLLWRAAYLPLFRHNSAPSFRLQRSAKTTTAEMPPPMGVAHSFSSSNLGQMQFDAFWSPHRTQMRLQSRRSQSREDLISEV